MPYKKVSIVRILISYPNTHEGDLDNALKYHQDALKIDQEIGHRQGEANQLGNIGLILKAKGDLDNALKYHQDALKIDQEIGHRQGEANQLGNIGLILQAKGDLDNALKYLKDALKIDQEIGHRQGEANQLGNIGLILQAKGDLDNALKYLKDALEIFNFAAPQLIIQTLYNIATIYFEKEINEKGFEYLAKAISSSTSSQQFNTSFSTFLRITRNMIVHNNWEKLQSINCMYNSGIIKERTLVYFFTAFYEYSRYKITSDEQHKCNFENLKQKLEPNLRRFINEILEVNQD